MAGIWTDNGDGWKLMPAEESRDEATLHDLVRKAPHIFPLAGSPSVVVLGIEDSFDLRPLLMGRIESESEPPNLPTEKNAGCSFFQARNPQSPLRIREGRAAKTPRIRGDFSGPAAARAESLCNASLGGGA